MKAKNQVNTIVLLVTVAILFAFAAAYPSNKDEKLSETQRLERFVADDPVMKDLTFDRDTGRSGYPQRISVDGVLHVESVPQFIDVLETLRKKERNREQAIDLTSTGITADIGGTSLVWHGRMLDRKDARRNEKLIEPLVAPGVAEIKATLYEGDIGLKLVAKRGSSLSDDEARAFRDKAYENFAADSDARLELCGFPLMHSTEFVEQSDCAPPILALNPEDGTYQELLERANRIDVATDMSLTVASGTEEHREEEYSIWGFYTEGEFDEEGLRAVKEILSETPEKRPTLIVIRGPEGALGGVYMGKPPSESALYAECPWQERMLRVLNG